MVEIFKKIMTVFSPDGPVTQVPPPENIALKQYNHQYRSVWDVIGERRMEAQRLVELHMPKSVWSTHYVVMENAFTWLPAIEADGPLPIEDMVNIKADIEHDPGLIDDFGQFQNICRLSDAELRPAEVNALPRALQLLRLAFGRLDSFAPDIDWPNTALVLCSPSGVTYKRWSKEAHKILPQAFSPRVTHSVRDFSGWLPKVLKSGAGAEHLLCVAVQSWATRSMIGSANAGLVAGESITLLKLRRVSKTSTRALSGEVALFPASTQEHCLRTQQPRKSIADLQMLVQGLCEQSDVAPGRIHGVISEGLCLNNRQEQLHEYLRLQLPQCDLQDHHVAVMPMCGRIGQAATQMTSVALAYLAVKAKPDGAVLVLDRESETATQGWLIASASSDVTNAADKQPSRR